MNKRKIFTLIELLVVIGIIAILLTILLPALKKAKDTGKRIACVSNLKNIGVTLGVYAVDFDGFFPIKGYAQTLNKTIPKAMKYGGVWRSSGGNTGSWSGSGMNWDVKLVSNYLNSGEIFYCPADPRGNNSGMGDSDEERGFSLSLADYPGYRNGSYAVQYYHAYFGLTYYGTYGSTFYRGFRLSDLSRYKQGNLMLMVDWMDGGTCNTFYNSDRPNFALNPSPHGKVVNFMAPDLSARSRAQREIQNDDEYWMPNKLP